MADAADVAATLQGTPPADPVSKDVAAAKPKAPGPTPATTRPQSFEAQLADIRKQSETVAAQQKADIAVAQKNAPAAPHIQPWTQQPPHENPAQSFGSAASMLGILASMLTRTPLTTALNASASAMRAIHDGDMERYDKAHQAWKDNIEIAVKNAQYENEAFDRAYSMQMQGDAAMWAGVKEQAALLGNEWQMHNDNVRLGIQANEALGRSARETQDRAERHDLFVQEQAANTRQILEAVDRVAQADPSIKNLPFVQQSQDPRVATALRSIQIDTKRQEMMASPGAAVTAAKGQQALDHEQNILSRAKQDNPKYDTMTLAEQSVARDQADTEIKAEAAGKKTTAVENARGGGQETAEAIDNDAATFITTGRIAWRTPPAQVTAIKNRAAEMTKQAGMTPEQFAAIPAEKKAAANTLIKNVAYRDAMSRSVKELDGMFDIAKTYLDKLPLTDIQSINAGIISGERSFGGADANNYANAMMSIANVYARMMAGPQSAGMIPVGVFNQAMGRLTSSISKGQFDGERDMMRKEGENIVSSTDQTIAGDRQQLETIRPGGGGGAAGSPAPGRYRYDPATGNMVAQ